ncbi:MAG: biotin carboxylase, partial [Gammaproteobacteria bacterium]|nr:biotin carboxylase [Gammaproteobacteria bacterium]
EDNVDIVTDAPQSGIWRMDSDGNVKYNRFDYHRRAVSNEQEAFFLRITGADDYRYEGADLGILILRGRSMTNEFVLNQRARNWIKGITSYYQAKPIPTATPVPEAGAFKIL